MYQGSGLGLAIAKKTVDGMASIIKLDTKPVWNYPQRGRSAYRSAFALNCLPFLGHEKWEAFLCERTSG